MQIHIPKLGDLLTLEWAWMFQLYGERRNETLFKKLNVEPNPNTSTWSAYRFRNMEVTLEAGTVLSVERIYIKRGQDSFNSVTFRVKNGPYKGARFWAKLDDVNNIRATINGVR